MLYRGERGGRAYDEDIIIDRNPERRRERDDGFAPRPAPPLAPPAPRPYDRRDERDIREEADYYNRGAQERSYIGEGYNGATQDWAIVDVPPGTKRVEMEGVGGGSQEVTWQRYNGVRRSKFMADGDEFGSDFGGGQLVPSGPRYQGVKDKKENMWTEITKDLVVKEAIEEMGYDFEETDYFYYIIAYLRYVSLPSWTYPRWESANIIDRMTSHVWSSSRRISAVFAVSECGRSSGSGKCQSVPLSLPHLHGKRNGSLSEKWFTRDGHQGDTYDKPLRFPTAGLHDIMSRALDESPIKSRKEGIARGDAFVGLAVRVFKILLSFFLP